MLKRFWVDNFKTLVNVEFLPQGVNLVVGKNNTGKTNLCEALTFLSWTAGFSLEDALYSVRSGWRLPNVYIAKPTIDFQVECRLTIDDEPHDFSYELSLLARRPRGKEAVAQALSVKSEVLRVSGGKFENALLLSNDSGHVRLLHEGRYLAEQQDLFGTPELIETTAPTDTTMLNRLYDLETNRLANHFKTYLRSWSYHKLNPAVMGSPDVKLGQVVLAPDGANLAAVLHSLHNERPKVMRDVIEQVRLVEPRITDISFVMADAEKIFTYLVDTDGNRFDLWSASDGTLRYIALWYLMMFSRDFSRGTGPPPLIIIEQPEDGLFVGHLKRVFQEVDPTGAYGQFIFTSHNPYFVDLFDSVPEGVHILSRVEPGSSQLRRPDPARIEGYLDDFSLGELHFREMLT